MCVDPIDAVLLSDRIALGYVTASDGACVRVDELSSSLLENQTIVLNDDELLTGYARKDSAEARSSPSRSL